MLEHDRQQCCAGWSDQIHQRIFAGRQHGRPSGNWLAWQTSQHGAGMRAAHALAAVSSCSTVKCEQVSCSLKHSDCLTYTGVIFVTSVVTSWLQHNMQAS